MTKRMVLALLALAGVFLSSYLALYKLGYVGHLACAIGSCEQVQTSRWSVFFGIPVASWGVGFYVTMLILSLIGTLPPRADSRIISWALLVLTGWGLAFSAYLTSVELFVIHAICEYCVTSAGLVAIMFAVAVAEMRERRRGAPDTAY